jgi:adenylate cyclase
MNATATEHERRQALDRLRGAVSNRRRLWRHSTRAVGLALFAVLVAFRVWDPASVEILRLKSLDAYQVLAPRPASIQPVAIVDIDERSLLALGQWPWSRSVVALLAERIMEAGAAVVAFDVVFAERDRLSPRALAREVPGLPGEAARAL